MNINDLKSSLGTGLGARKNRYMLEIPLPISSDVRGRTLNILCQSAGFPERSITTASIWHKGRQYVVRGETDFGNEYPVTFIDDDRLSIRKLMDAWCKEVDNSHPKNTSVLGGSIEEFGKNFLDELISRINIVNEFKIFTQILNGSVNQYQTDINVWQIDNDDNRIYGYKLQNAFPKRIGEITFSDNEENTLTEFTTTFAFSEFIPIYG